MITIITIITLSIFLCMFFYLVGKSQGNRDSVSRYFTPDSLHLVIPSSDITQKRAEEIAKFIVAKKEMHERSHHNEESLIHNKETDWRKDGRESQA